MPRDNALDLLRLMQLADSALPIGGAAHSFGLESLAAEGALEVADLPRFLEDWLAEVGLADAVFCRAAHAGCATGTAAELNRSLSALRPARESRQASLTLGRRFLQLVAAFGEPLELAEDIHLAIAFGYAGGRLGFECEATVLAFLHQSAAALVSACQRLMPLGQSGASRILWELKPALAQTALHSARVPMARAGGFAPLLEIASMRHPALETRLFIS